MHNRMRGKHGRPLCHVHVATGTAEYLSISGRILDAQDNCLVKSVDTGTGSGFADQRRQQFTCMFRKEGDLDVTLFGLRATRQQ